jgi:hypothetical protein
MVREKGHKGGDMGTEPRRIGRRQPCRDRESFRMEEDQAWTLWCVSKFGPIEEQA